MNITQLVKENPNDLDLGKAVRPIISTDISNAIPNDMELGKYIRNNNG